MRDNNDAKSVLSVIEPLKSIDVNKIRTDMYGIPATQMLHKCMFHETSRAQRDIEDEVNDVYSDEQQKLIYNRSNNSSVLDYIATHKMTSSLGTC